MSRRQRHLRRPFLQIGIGLVLLMACLVRDAEAGVNRWTTTGPESRNIVQVTSFGFDPSAPATLYAATAGGVFKTVNGGESWTAINGAGLTGQVRFLAIDPSTAISLYAVSYGRELFKSSDGGASWMAINSGLPSDNSV